MKKVFILFVYIIFNFQTYSQENEDIITQISRSYKNFEYEKVIAVSESLITHCDQLPQSLLSELFRLKALSHFSLGEEDLAQICFISILDINPDFKLDPLENSPKIIHFFNRLKDQYLEQQKHVSELVKKPESPDTVFVPQQEKSVSSRSAFLRSIVIPGWGHLYMKKKTKAYIFGSLAVATSVSSVYFVFRTRDKEKKYLKEIISTKIEDRYQSYNHAYKLRNLLLSSYILIWLYTQFDLLLNEKYLIENNSENISLLPTYNYPDHITLNLAIQF